MLLAKLAALIYWVKCIKILSTIENTITRSYFLL